MHLRSGIKCISFVDLPPHLDPSEHNPKEETKWSAAADLLRKVIFFTFSYNLFSALGHMSIK